MRRLNPAKTFAAPFCGATVTLLIPLFIQASALGQTTTPETRDSSPTRLPETIVTAQKTAEDLRDLPLSVSAVRISDAGEGEISTVKDAAIYAPNVFINEFSARALSNPFFRGIGGSPANPGVTTYIDGVPQLNSYSSSIQLMDVEQVEFVRGPQGALFGRNTPGGLINITSRKPSREWTGEASGMYGNYNAHDVRARVSGPVAGDDLSLGIAAGYAARDGFTENLFNGDDIDSREAWFGKGQVFFTPTEAIEARFILTLEQDRDGDYALGDLGAIRRNPWKVNRDFTEGYNDRDIVAPTLQLSYTGEKIKAESITAFVYWKNDALTDLDYGVASPSNFYLNATRSNVEKQDQFTQELRLSSLPEGSLSVLDEVDLSWQSGVFLFAQQYEQDTMNSFAPPLNMLSGGTHSDLRDKGVGVYGQVKAEVYEKLELSAGLRFDAEEKDATLGSSIALPADLDDTFTEVSPQFGLVFHVTQNQFAFASVARGYKAGGFNPRPAGVLAPAGSEMYDTEHTWNYEVGYRIRAFEETLELTASLFYTAWEDLQLNQQYPGTAAQYFIQNAGEAASKGVEIEAKYRLIPELDLFAGAGLMEARFLSGTTAFNANRNQDENVGGNHIPYAPEFKVLAGAEGRYQPLAAITLFARAQVTVFGNFEYDASNTQGQDTYSLADFRAGVRGKNWFVEGWIANAFDTEYVPIAIPYAALGAPSGYIGENGAPATYGIRAGLMF